MREALDRVSKEEFNQAMQLARLYFDEWIERERDFWKCVNQWFIAILMVILVPNLAKDMLHIDIGGVPTFVFPIIGAILSILAMFYLRSYTIRISFVLGLYYDSFAGLGKYGVRDKAAFDAFVEKSTTFSKMHLKLKLLNTIVYVMFGLLAALGLAMTCFSYVGVTP